MVKASLLTDAKMHSLTGSSSWLAFTRFAISGGIAACIAVAVYVACAVVMPFAPLTANLLSYVAQLGVSYQLHRSVSFAGARGGLRSMTRYGALSLAAFACNSLWVWILTHGLRWPAWTPLVPMIAVTPVMTFLLARHWVFDSSDRRI
jgi:putative flippase GtrA